LGTTPTVSEPSSFETLAMTGAAPVPVPPPMPQVMKIMSASARYSLRRSTSSWAARLPISGLPPAPRPRVSCSPSCILIGERLALRACESVLAAMKSTPGRPAAIMVFTALPPPPPTPTTLIRAPPGQHDPRGERLVAARALDLALGERQHLLRAWLDHLGQGAPREVVGRTSAEPRHLDRLLRGRERGERAPVALLQALGLGGGGAERGREIARHVPAAHREHRRVADGAGLVDDHV